MKVTRRVVLKMAGGIGLGMSLPAAPGARAAAPASLDAQARQTLLSFFETLIPADGASPGAAVTGIDRRIALLADGDDSLRRQVADACRWLDNEARRLGAGAFSRLDENRRNLVLRKASRLSPRLPMRQFFDRARRIAFYAYYSRASSWPAIAYAGPPQPQGFADYALPPVKQRGSSDGS